MELVADLHTEFIFNEKITEFVRTTKHNFIELLELSLEADIFNSLLIELERLSGDFISKLKDKQKIYEKMDQVITDGMTPIKIEFDNHKYNSHMLKSKLEIELSNNDVSLSDNNIYVGQWKHNDTYKGQWKNMKPNGKGIMTKPYGLACEATFIDGKACGDKCKYTWRNGSYYEGSVTNDRYHGFGIKVEKENGVIIQKYEGNFSNGEFSGNGILIRSDGGKYEGPFKNNYFHGLGTYTYPNGDKCHGEYINGENYGMCKITECKSGVIYLRQFKNDRYGIYNGHSTLIAQNDDIYIGNFVNGMIEGYGELACSNQDVYKGIFLNGQLNGKGTLIKSTGSTYTGNFINGQLCGKGTRTNYWEDVMDEKTYEETYEGDFLNTVEHGKGRLSCTNGNYYEGEFVNGETVGYGISHNDRFHYEGNFESGMMNGKGKIIFPNKNQYEGEFLNGKLNGHGEYIWNNGDKFVGIFVNDKIHGEGIMTKSCDKKQYKGIFASHDVFPYNISNGFDGTLDNKEYHIFFQQNKINNIIYNKLIVTRWITKLFTKK